MLIQKSQSLLTRQLHLGRTCARCAVGCVCLVGLALLSACGKSPESNVSAVVPEALQPAASAKVSDANIDAAIGDALATTNRPPPIAEREANLTAQAEDVLARYPDKNAAELLAVPEVSAKLKIGLQKLGEDPALGKQISSTVDLAAKLKGLEGGPGSARLDLDIKTYDRTRTRRMLETVFSEDPKRIVGFLVEEIGEAAPELSYGGVKRASNGIAIESNPPPSPPK